MDTLHFDAYSSYSDGSTPRTPSPGSSLSLDDSRYQQSPSFFKASFDDQLYPDMHHASVGIAPEWASPHHGAAPLPQGRGGPLLQDLYESDMHAHGHPHHGHPGDVYLDHSAEPHYGGAEWSGMPYHPHHPHHPSQQHSLPPMRSHHDGVFRRSTYPYARHDQEHMYSHPPPPPYPEHPPIMGPYGPRGDLLYGEPMPLHGSPHMLAADPSALHGEPYPGSHMPSPHHGFVQLDDGNVKMEDNVMMVPSQAAFYRPPSAGMQQQMPYHISPHNGIPIQHTDDAASKETQYLRRRCFNCHTTEPPSWRRSTLNPGKIVCNKCGLYERTHLRPRPLRFDELRAGSKARKNSKAGGVAASPKARPPKKDARQQQLAASANETISRRASVSSVASSFSGSSDWDETASVYSNSSAPGSGFSSPAQPSFPLSRESDSPPTHAQDAGIRLPTGGLSDVSLQKAGAPTPPPAQPVYFTPADAFAGRRNTLPTALPSSAEVNGHRARSGSDMELPEATGWQAVDVPPTSEKTSKVSTPRSKPIAVV